MLSNKHILLGVTGSIAAYKSADLIRKLKEAGAIVRVVMTEKAKAFITPLTLQAVSGFPVHDDLFDLSVEAAMGHIQLARWADALIVAPASADFIARLAQGEANDLLTTLCLATRAPMSIAPAMNQQMWHQAATQANVERLVERGIQCVGPADGSQACGEIGKGRMSEPDEIVLAVGQLFETQALMGVKILVTAGPTHEAIDPIRYLTNGSSGKMGYALAQAALEAGAKVALVSGPVSLKAPAKADYTPVISAEEMYAVVMRKMPEYDILLAVAAVSDYRSQTVSSQKMHKKEEITQLTLVRNPDIVAACATLLPKPFIVGFAAETEDVVQNAQVKRQQKKMDIIIANAVGQQRGMGVDDNEVTMITPCLIKHFPCMTKTSLARQLVAMIATEYRRSR